MNRKTALFLLIASASLAACGGQGASSKEASSSSAASKTYQEKYGDFLFTKTELKPEYYAEVPNHGTVVTEEYDTYAYAYDAQQENPVGTTRIHKRLQVYLPFGYDKERKYDIAYFMHGGGDDEEYWLTTRAKYILPTLDNLMYNKKCRDVIIVCPTFYSWPDAEAEVKDDSLNADFPQYFPIELENEVMPLVESKYHTYADLDTSDESLIASRQRRAFCGLSMGSMTSQEVLAACPDKFAYIGSFSGEMTKKDPDHGYQRLYDALHSEEFNQYKINFWYNQNGTADMAHDPHEDLSKHVLADMGDKFVDGENYAWIDIKGGAHAFNVWWVGLYNTLQLFFPVSK
ncbi:MAG: hypothetical protein J6A47_01520 [Bacilli bacterium]|nr:hypothetical protein [Bacilli bacterium]